MTLLSRCRRHMAASRRRRSSRCRPSKERPSRSTHFPFDVNPLRVQLIRRHVDRGVFPDPAAFREAYFKATPVAVDFTLCSQSH